MAWTEDSYLTREEYDRLAPDDRTLHDLIMAARKNDWEKGDELLKQVDFPPEALMALRRVKGADYIRDLGVRTQTAETKYGRNWLEA
ncbi:hypothetical protein IHV25_07035 [Phaeovibrio sulfidiphilus]|uniref:Uncharacterized protein n=1 Tax=Phaeovibrio sulfidiphilus TaxID=1220600 RepID=A0A8J6YMW3_9PROT|nr:hypothetical protein [Phaeovibrio sulfidiphilus]MBE1237400.1 hypothetical protein [Phaeovibrio sulfidiphilus]